MKIIIWSVGPYSFSVFVVNFDRCPSFMNLTIILKYEYYIIIIFFLKLCWLLLYFSCSVNPRVFLFYFKTYCLWILKVRFVNVLVSCVWFPKVITLVLYLLFHTMIVIPSVHEEISILSAMSKTSNI